MSIPMKGFDMLVHIRMAAVQRVLSYQYSTGGFPASAEGTAGSLVFRALFDTPMVSAKNTQDNDLEVRMPFSEASYISGMAPISNIDGAFTLRAPLKVIPVGQTRNVVFDLPNPQTDESFIFDHDERLPAVVAAFIRLKSIDELASYRDALNALPPLTMQGAPYSAPFTPSEVFLRVMRPANVADHAITLAMPTGNPQASTGDITTIAAPDLKGGYDAGINISSDTLLSRMVRPALADAVMIPDSAFSAPCRLSTPTSVLLDGQPVRFEKLDAVVDSGRFRIDGKLTMTGGELPEGVSSAEITFRIWIRPYLENGVIKMQMTVEEPLVDIEFEWWVIILAGALPILTVGVAGLFVGTVVAALTVAVTAIVESFVEGEISGGVGTVLGDVGDDLANESIGTGAARGLITLRELTLDPVCMTLYGDLDAAAKIPLASSGTLTLKPGQGCDLDTGRVYRVSEIRPDHEGIDLLWTPANAAAALTPTDGSRILRRQGVFRDLTVVEIEQLLVDFRDQDFGGPFSRGWLHTTDTAAGANGVIYYYQTGENRYGEAVIWQQGDDLRVRHITYQRSLGPKVVLTPILGNTTLGPLVASGIEMIPSIECNAGFGFGDRVFSGGPVVSASPVPYERFASKTLLGYRMGSELLAFPLVSTQWSLNGQTVTGSGTQALGNGKSVNYEIVDDVIFLSNEFEQTVGGHLRARVTDARLLTIERTVSFYLSGTTKSGGSGPEAREGQVNPSAVKRYQADLDRCLKTVRVHERLMHPVFDLPNGGLPGLTQPQLTVQFAEAKTGRLLSTSAMQGVRPANTVFRNKRPELHYHDI